MGLSVVIPTYNNVEYLKELFDSIEKVKFNDEYEILIGIDSCKSTLKYVYEHDFTSNFNFFYFEENIGPYIIRNTLCNLSKFDKLLFFDSDDIVLPDLFTEINDKLNFFDLVKPKYIDFKDVDNERKFSDKKNTFGEGVFGIKKDLFLSINGFEGWRVAADSDLMSRLYKMKIKILHTSHVLFHRRIHPNSLTVHPETGLSSRMRSLFFTKSKNKKKEEIKLDTYETSEYKVVNVTNKELLKSFEELQKEQELTDYEEKKLKHEKVSEIFSKGPKNNPSRQNKVINYDLINKNMNHTISSKLGTALKKAKLEEIRRGSRR